MVFWVTHPRKDPMTSTDSPVVVVTGALAGIGRATALAFAERHANVVVSGRRPEVGEQLADELLERGAAGSAFFRTDVRSDDDLRALVDGTLERFGRLDVAVNNAGAMGMGFLPDTEPADYAHVFDTNVLGTVLSLRHELRVMQPQGSGAIVNVSSVYGDKGFHAGALYPASKHAVIGLTRSAALEAAPYGIRVNAVAPGATQTEMLETVVNHDAEAKAGFLATVPLKRAAEPEEIADAIVYLAVGRGAGYITGQTIFLDGGVSAS
jgi:NAD(P)-dependent dehydrogenase (short-subunit alcohol dehydrogenase family)